MPTGHPLRVLIVDDTADAADSLALLTRLWGHEVRGAYNGPDALRQAALTRPHIVLLDIAMPGMTGFEVAQRLKTDLGLKETVVVAVTATDDAALRPAYENSGILYRLGKPYQPAEVQQLLALLKQAVRHE